MGGAQVVVLVAITGVLAWRVIDARAATASDIRTLQGRYRAKGLEPVSIRRLGTDWMLFKPRLTRAGAIRVYEVAIRHADCEAERRVRGVSRAISGGVILWRRGAQGEWESVA